MSDHLIPDEMARRVAALVNEAEDAIATYQEQKREAYADLREELKSLGWRGAAISEQIAAFKSAIAEARLDDTKREKRDRKDDLASHYLNILAQVRVRAHGNIEEFDPETGEINAENDRQHIGRTDEEQRPAPRVQDPDGGREGADEGDQGQGAGASEPDRTGGLVSGNIAGEDQDRGSRHVGGEARHEITQSGGGEVGAVNAKGGLPDADSVEPPPSGHRWSKLRPNCLNPDRCGGVGDKHCFTCRQAMKEAEDAA